jgi:hypothetical protein
VSRSIHSMLSSVEHSRSSESKMPAAVLGESEFQRLISQERKRSERSQRPFVLLLIDTGLSLPAERVAESSSICFPRFKKRPARPT